MRRRRYNTALVVIGVTLTAGTEIAVGCSTSDSQNGFGVGGQNSGADEGSSVTSGGKGGAGGAGTTVTSSAQGLGGGTLLPDSGPDVVPDVAKNPCGSKCGPTELCDPDHLGLDDNCNGLVDEGCNCQPGQVHSCFKGDPSYEGVPGCFDGSEKCTENGLWGNCAGGVHATDNCFANDMSSCHAITAVPFQTVHLETGTGSFSANATSESWKVACPAGVNPCPGVSGMSPADSFQALQSGEYTVTYTKGESDGGMASCTYPLFVGAPGLRIELTWEHDLGGPGDEGVDLDLHLHQPMDTNPWSIDGAVQECLWSNCTVDAFTPPQDPDAPESWFPANAMPPDPVAWYLDPVLSQNTCYFAPHGNGASWQALGQGCHNPRLDLDNITCDPTIVDVDDEDFCAPENINVDFPPTKQWMRVGVHYYSSHDEQYDVHPVVKIFCDGALAAQLGDQGYYKPMDGGVAQPITFTPADGQAFDGNKFWLVADVEFPVKDMCNKKSCTVEPVFADPINKTPYFTTDTDAEMQFGPPYPPIP